MAHESTTAASLVRIARGRANLSQRELARRAHTAQSVVARIELGDVSPTVETLERLLAAAGFDLSAHLEPKPVLDRHALDDVPRILRLTPEERLDEVRNVSRLLAHATRIA